MWVPWLINICYMTHSYVWHDSFIFVTCIVHMCDMAHSYVRHDPVTCVTRPINMCNTTHSYGWHDSLMCATWPIHTCEMTHVYVQHDPFTRVTWPTHMCDVHHSYMRHARPIHTNHLSVWHDTSIPVTWQNTHTHSNPLTHQHVKQPYIQKNTFPRKIFPNLYKKTL